MKHAGIGRLTLRGVAAPALRIALVPALLGAVLAGAARGQVITEFSLSPGSGAWGIAAGPDGNVWFTEAHGNAIGRITPAGEITEFPIPTPAAFPEAITAGPDGDLWFTEYDANKIGKITTSGAISEFAIPTNYSGPTGITAGPDGNLWFTEGTANKIGRITTSGAISEFAIPSVCSNNFLNSCFPHGIAAGPDGNLWFTESGFHNIGRITTSGVVEEFSLYLYRGLDHPNDIAAGPDGNLWFTAGHLGRITPAGVVTEFDLPVELTAPSGIAAGPDGNLWVVSASVGRITTDGSATAFPLPADVSWTGAIAAGPDGNVWFTEGAAAISPHYPLSRVANITPSKGPCVADSTTLCLNQGRFRIETRWRVPSQGTTGEGKAVALTPDTGYFWFFQETNVEIVVKALTGCTINQNFWIFAGGLTNVEVTLTVTDTETGQVKTYVNPADTAFLPIQDTAAFATCPAAAMTSPRATGPESAEYLARQVRRKQADQTAQVAATKNACADDPTTLCLNDSRFQVQADWRVPSQGISGHAMAVGLTPDTGYFWFFQPSNVELIVKVLNGCGINQHAWVFAGGLTNVEVTLTVTDTQTREVKTYVNPPDTAFLPIQDTAAFGTCD